MLLKDKTAIIYGAGGAIGGAVARAFAKEGARLHLAGRSLARVEAIARDVQASFSRMGEGCLLKDKVAVIMEAAAQ